jgi:hypothetical protein
MHAIQSQLLQAFGAIFGNGHTILLLYSGRTQLHFYPGASERSHQKDLLEQLNTRIERGGQRVQRSVILRSRTRFLEEQKSMASRQRTNTSPTNCTIVLKEELDKRAKYIVFLFSRNYHEPSCN